MTAAEETTPKAPDDRVGSEPADARPEEATPEDSRPLTPEARRALAEAEERRRKAAAEPPLPPEVGGRTTPEPTRYGDWETGGIASDF
jgi:hypothetical protein